MIDKRKMISKRSIIINIALMLIVTALTVYYFLKNDLLENLHIAQNIPIYGYFILLGMVLLIILCEALVIHLTYINVGCKIRFIDSIGVVLYGNLGSNITPAKSGHYPFMLYYNEKKNIRVDKSLNVFTQDQVIYSTVMIMVYLITFIACCVNNFTLEFEGYTLEVKWFCLIGMVANVFFALCFLLIVFVKPLNHLVVKISAFILYHSHKIDDKDVFYEEQNEQMLNLRKDIAHMLKTFYDHVLQMLIYLIYVLIRYSLPYVIYLILTGVGFDIRTFVLFFALAQVTTYVSNLVPVPGNLGAAEIAFVFVFGTIVSEEVATTSMVFWRIATFYLMVLMDFVFFIITMIIDSRKKRKMMESVEIENSPLVVDE